MFNITCTPDVFFYLLKLYTVNSPNNGQLGTSPFVNYSGYAFHWEIMLLCLPIPFLINNLKTISLLYAVVLIIARIIALRVKGNS